MVYRGWWSVSGFIIVCLSVISGSFLEPENFAFLRDSIIKDNNIHISGSPGCGKSFVVRSVIEQLDIDHQYISTEKSSFVEVIFRPSFLYIIDDFDSSSFAFQESTLKNIENQNSKFIIISSNSSYIKAPVLDRLSPAIPIYYSDGDWIKFITNEKYKFNQVDLKYFTGSFGILTFFYKYDISNLLYLINESIIQKTPVPFFKFNFNKFNDFDKSCRVYLAHIMSIFSRDYSPPIRKIILDFSRVLASSFSISLELHFRSCVLCLVDVTLYVMPVFVIDGDPQDFLVEQEINRLYDHNLCHAIFRIKTFSNYTPDVFDQKRRLFIIEDYQPDIPDIESDTIVIIKSKVSKLPSHYKKISVESINVKKQQDIQKWIHQYGKKFNIDLSKVSSALFVNHGSALRKLAIEIEKIFYLHGPGVITPDDIRPLIYLSNEVTPKNIIEAVDEGNTRKALAYYDFLQGKIDETGWIIAYFHRHSIQCAVLSKYSEAMTDDAISDFFKIPRFFIASAKFRSTCRTYDSWKSCSDLMSRLDVLHKSGHPSAPFLLEKEIIRLSEEISK